MITPRDLLRGVAGTVGLLGWPSGHASGEPPPETTRLRIPQWSSICVAPQYIVGELLKSEGFSDIKYVKLPVADPSKALASGDVDISLHFVAPLVIQLDAGDPITLLGGVHVGCYELFGTDRVRVIRDLKGKTVAITGLTQRVFLSRMIAYVGLDPNKDVTFAEHPAAEGKRLLEEGKVDAYLGFTPRYDYAVETMKNVPYNKWRVYDPEDSVRFYALRLREARMIKSTPQRLIAEGTDWRFFNDLKKELKG